MTALFRLKRVDIQYVVSSLYLKFLFTGIWKTNTMCGTLRTSQQISEVNNKGAHFQAQRGLEDQ